MAVYTDLGTERLAELIAAYDVGDLVSAKGIAEGVSNSNWLIETSGKDGGPRKDSAQSARFILTMYERRIETADLPFFLDLLDHLSAADCPVPRTIHDGEGASFRMVEGKAVALIEFLPGVSPTAPSAAQARAVGVALARMHAAAQAFPGSRVNDLGPQENSATLESCGSAALAQIDPDLPEVLPRARAVAEAWPSDLPRSIIHSDLFPDNVLMLGDRVTGMIDFYFACTGSMAYDLAVTHAAWCFDGTGLRCDRALGRALIEGYETLRPLGHDERVALPLLAEGACLRFIASRAQDWIETPAGALVIRKDPMDFVRRWNTYRDLGQEAFA